MRKYKYHFYSEQLNYLNSVVFTSIKVKHHPEQWLSYDQYLD